jgi:hypothetical protein
MWNVQRDKISTLGMQPGNVRHLRQFLVEDLEHLLEFRRQQRAMLIHERVNAGLVPQKSHMA